MLDRRPVASFVVVLLWSFLPLHHHRILFAHCSEQQFISRESRNDINVEHVDGRPNPVLRKRQRRIAVEPSPRIINGWESDRSRHPYVALLTAKHVLKCGGSMIAPDIILTAAHCTESFSEAQLGRHNRTDDTEVYQSLIVETIVNHPRYFRNHFMDVDPHDFAVVKLYGRMKESSSSSSSTSSSTDFIRINRNPSLPTPNQQLYVYGWGAINPEDFREQSDVLRETDAFYIPNDECRQVVGTYRDITIDYQQVVIDATMCAMNFENLTDSCRGDSGGGLIIRGETPQDDVLVGVVSAGYGCAHPILPALYARVSKVDEWIRESVCSLSEHPPAYLECVDLLDTNIDDKDTQEQQQQQQQPNLGLVFPCDDIPVGRDGESTDPAFTRTGIPCTAGDTPLTVILELRLDTAPVERGWLLRRKNNAGQWITELERPIFSYSSSDPMSTVRETLFLPMNHEYEIVLLDSYGDGNHDMGVTPTSNILRLFDQDTYDDILTITNFSTFNGNGYHQSSFFTLGVPPTYPPSSAPSPTTTSSPSMPFITVNITFGGSPENIGFNLEKLLDSEVGEDVDFDDHLELQHAVYPGSFSPELRHSNVTVEVPLKGSADLTKPQIYFFTMTSNEGQGMETGSYQVWMGRAGEGELLFEGDTFYYEETTSFQVDPQEFEFDGGETIDACSRTPSSGLLSLLALALVLVLL